jgi:hypothetical protein
MLRTKGGTGRKATGKNLPCPSVTVVYSQEGGQEEF